jgi:GTP-binding protein Era
LNQVEGSKAGFVAVVGRPNAGKSSLLNWVINEKIAMVSHKANATRKRANIIAMYENNQIIFVDTPGIHDREKLINQFMLNEAIRAIGDCDLILFLAPIHDNLEHYENFLELNKKNLPHIVLLTKVDTISKDDVLKKLEEYKKYEEKYLEIIPMSIKKGSDRNYLLKTVANHIPEHPFLFDPEILTTSNMREIYKEFIRESIFDNISDEIPYESDVIIDKVEEKKGLDKIYATIVVETNNQKGMLIGKGATAIKRIGKDARLKIESLTGQKCFLSLFVSVKKGWSKNKKSLKEFGYDFD